MKITVAICTWNRADLLDQTLRKMHDLLIPEGVEWELLVVNNNCTDHTDDIIARHSAHLPLRRLFESKQGHSNARNCAVAAANGELLIWTDDDVLVDPHWLEAYVRAAKEHPECDFFGGPIEPWFASPPPKWIRRHQERLEGILILRKPMSHGAPIVKGQLPFGANVAFRTSVFKDIRFNPALGRCGKGLLGGEETEVMTRLIADGRRGCWVSNAKLRHYVVPERCTVRYLIRFYEAMGYTNASMNGLPNTPRICGLPRYAIRRCLEDTLTACYTAPFRNSRWLRAVSSAARARGTIRYAIENRHVLS